MIDFDEVVKIILKAIPDVIAIYRFGSAGTEYETSESDLDIAILPRSKINAMTRFELTSQLMSVAHKDFVDLIDLFNAPPILKKEIVLNGQRICCKNINKAEQFEDLAFSQDLFFNEERSQLVNDILARGSVY